MSIEDHEQEQRVQPDSSTHSGERIELGDLGDLGDGEMRVFDDVGPYGVLICRADGAMYAIENNCSHADTPLSEGRLRGYAVTCPLHGAQFDVRTGAHSGPPAWEGVPCYAVEEIDGVVSVSLVVDDPVDDNETDGFGQVGARFRTR